MYASRQLEGRARRAWRLLAFAQVGYTFGELIWGAVEVGLHANPFPTLGDTGFIIFYPIFLTGMGILLLPDEPFSAREKIKVFIDISILTISAALLFWIFLFSPIITASKEISLGLALAVICPALDLVLLLVLLLLLFRKLGSCQSYPLMVIALALTSFMVTNAVFCIQVQQKSYIPGSLLDTGWLISYLLLGLAGVWQARLARSGALQTEASRPTSTLTCGRATWTHYLPYFGAGLAFFLAFWSSRSLSSSSDIAIAASLAIIIGLMLLRQRVELDESEVLLQRTFSEIEERRSAEAQLLRAKAEAEAARLPNPNSWPI